MDVDERTFNLDPDQLEKAIAVVKQQGKLRPRAVVAVDLFGQPADYERIEAICKEHGLLLLEDGAQGFGGSIGERRACSFGDAATTSVFPAKPLGCYGDGGAVCTNDDQLDELLRSCLLYTSVLFHSILVTNFARIEKILDRRGRFLYLVVFVLYYVQITVNAGYNEPLIEVLFLMVPALLVLNTERYGAQVPAVGAVSYTHLPTKR